MTDLLLRRVSESRPGADGQDDYDVIGTDGMVIGRIFTRRVGIGTGEFDYVLTASSHWDRRIA
jgi:hypothetical protein